MHCDEKSVARCRVCHSEYADYGTDVPAVSIGLKTDPSSVPRPPSVKGSSSEQEGSRAILEHVIGQTEDSAAAMGDDDKGDCLCIVM